MSWKFLCVLLIAAQQIISLTTWASTFEDELAKAEANLCAVTPAIPTAADPAQATEATTCENCKKAETSTTPLPLPALTGPATPELSETEKTRIRRDYEFFKWYSARSNYAYNPFQCSAANSIDECEKIIQKFQDAIKPKEKVLGDLQLLFTNKTLALKEMADLATGKIPSKEALDIIGGLADKQILSAQNRFFRLKLERDYYMVANPKHYTPKVIAEENESIKEAEKTLAKAKALSYWINKPANPAFLDPELLNLIKATLVNEIDGTQLYLEHITKDVDLIRASLKKAEEQLLLLKNAAMGLAPQLEDFAVVLAGLSIYEKNFSDRVKFNDRNRGYKDCNLSVAEKVAFQFYTGSGYREINRALRTGGTSADKFKLMTAMIEAGLQKLSPYQGQVKRGAQLPSEALSKYQVGSVITEPAYTSTSLTSGFSAAHQFVIKSVSGHYVAPYSAHPSEFEVLFSAGAKFKVLQRKEEEGGRIQFVLEQVTSQEAVPSP